MADITQEKARQLMQDLKMALPSGNIEKVRYTFMGSGFTSRLDMDVEQSPKAVEQVQAIAEQNPLILALRKICIEQGMMYRFVCRECGCFGQVRRNYTQDKIEAVCDDCGFTVFEE